MASWAEPIEVIDGEPYCPYCTDGLATEELGPRCGLPGCMPDDMDARPGGADYSHTDTADDAFWNFNQPGGHHAEGENSGI